MDILTLFVIVPVITVIILGFAKDLKQARVIALIGMLVQFGMSVNLIFAYIKERSVNTDIMVFVKDYAWFESFNIHYIIGVDAISVVMIALTLVSAETATVRPKSPGVSSTTIEVENDIG